MRFQDCIFSISKIVDGAANGDYSKVAAYVSHLASQLEQEGDKSSSKKLMSLLERSKARRFIPNSVGTASQLSSIPVDNEFRLPMAVEQRASSGDVPLYLSQDAGDTVRQFVEYVRQVDRLLVQGISVSSSMLLYGPPGCGKTQTARYIASELKLPLITARMDGIISSYLGATAKNLRTVFEHFSSFPCVLFLDEVDAVGKLRDDVNELGELKRVVISLLQNIDAFDSDHVLIAASNHDHLLDPALWRRFTYKVKLTKPDTTARRAILSDMLAKYATDDLIEALAIISIDQSGAELVQMAEEAVRAFVLRGDSEFSLVDCLNAGKRIGASSEAFISSPISDQIRRIHMLDEKRFPGSRLAKLFNIPQTTVYRMMREDSKADAKFSISSDQISPS